MNSVEELYKNSDYLSLHIPATEQTKGSIGYDLLMSMPKGATLVNTARKEVIDEQGVMKALTEREDLKYITDIAAGIQSELNENSAGGCSPRRRRWAPRPPRPTSMPVWLLPARSWTS